MLNSSDEQRTARVTRIVALGMIAGMAISWPLWMSSRDLPCIPLLGPDRIPPPFDVLLAGAAFALLAALLARPGDRRILAAFVALLAGLALQDQIRWQPWAWQYLLLLVPLLFSNRKPALDLQRCIVAGVYCWSGLHKFGPGFRTMYERYLAVPLLDLSPAWVDAGWLAFAWLIPVIETGIGLGLLFRPAQKTCAILAIGLHAFVLLLIGPLGLGANHVIWPWNLAMIALVAVLFLPPVTIEPGRMLAPGLRAPAAALLALTWVMPGLYYAGAWDHYLSFNLYSGRGCQAILYLSPTAADAVDEAHKNLLVPSVSEAGWYEIRFAGSSMSEMRVPIAEPRTFKALARRILKPGTADGEAFLFLRFSDLAHLQPVHIKPSELRE